MHNSHLQNSTKHVPKILTRKYTTNQNIIWQKLRYTKLFAQYNNDMLVLMASETTTSK